VSVPKWQATCYASSMVEPLGASLVETGEADSLRFPISLESSKMGRSCMGVLFRSV
jgi:hypothetical protein